MMAAASIVLVLVLERVAADEPDKYPAPGGEPLCKLAALSVGSGGSRERLLASQLYRLRYDPENGKTALELAIRWVLNHPSGARKPFEDDDDDEND
jgi:hypothetical protein